MPSARLTLGFAGWASALASCAPDLFLPIPAPSVAARARVIVVLGDGAPKTFLQTPEDSGRFESSGGTLTFHALFYDVPPAELGAPGALRCVAEKPLEAWRAEVRADGAGEWSLLPGGAPAEILDLLIPDRASACSPCRQWRFDWKEVTVTARGEIAVDLGYPNGLAGFGDGQLFRVRAAPLELTPIVIASTPHWADAARAPDGTLFAYTAAGTLYRAPAEPEALAPIERGGWPPVVSRLAWDEVGDRLLIVTGSQTSTVGIGAVTAWSSGGFEVLARWTRAVTDGNEADIALDATLGALIVGPPGGRLMRLQGDRVATEALDTEGSNLTAIAASPSRGIFVGNTNGAVFERVGNVWLRSPEVGFVEVRTMLSFDESLLVASDARQLFEWFRGHPVCPPMTVPFNFRRLIRFGPGILAVTTVVNGTASAYVVYGEPVPR